MSFPEALGWYLATGVVAGTLAGLLGIGGGTIIVPMLLWVFTRSGFEASVTTQLALGTCLGTIVFTSLSSVHAHHGRGAVRWDAVARLATGIVLGAAGGAWLASRIQGRHLQLLYVAFAAFVGWEMFRKEGLRPSPRDVAAAWYPPAGIVIGAASSLFGIGGGTLSVPFLMWTRLDVRVAVGTSAACGFPIALGGATAYAWFGRHVASLPEGALGFVYGPALAAVAASSVICARLGARLAHVIPREQLRRVFAVLLWLVAAKLAIGF